MSRPTDSIDATDLQTLLDAFVAEYNKLSPSPVARSHLDHRPQRRQSRRVRHDRIDKSGTVTLRVDGQLRHIGVGRTHTGTHVILLIQDLDVRVVNAITGELLRELTIDPDTDYQPRGHPEMTNSRTCTP